jgi:hypothetical protein
VTRSATTKRFRAAFLALSATDQDLARKAFRLWRNNSSHPSLRFKALQGGSGVWSARVTRELRALAVQGRDGAWIWFWIGSHADYDRMISKL